MIQVGAEDTEAQSSMRDLTELHERLSYHIGAIVSVEIDRDRERRLKSSTKGIGSFVYSENGTPLGSRTVTSGRLERVKLTEGIPGQSTFGYCFEGDTAIREDISLADSSVKVLLDGVWKIIHEPEAWRVADQEESAAAELKRLAITPLSQWTEDERRRHGQPSLLETYLKRDSETSWSE